MKKFHFFINRAEAGDLTHNVEFMYLIKTYVIWFWKLVSLLCIWSIFVLSITVLHQWVLEFYYLNVKHGVPEGLHWLTVSILIYLLFIIYSFYIMCCRLNLYWITIKYLLLIIPICWISGLIIISLSSIPCLKYNLIFIKNKTSKAFFLFLVVHNPKIYTRTMLKSIITLLWTGFL